MIAVIVEAVTTAALTAWAGCTLLILIVGVLHLPYGRVRALAIRCGRPVHRWVPILQAALFTTSALHDPAGAWWVDIGWSVLVVLVWLAICHIGVYRHPDASHRDASHSGSWHMRLGSRIGYVLARRHHQPRPARVGLRPGPGTRLGTDLGTDLGYCGLPDEAATRFGEALAAMTVVLDVATRCRRRQAGAKEAVTGGALTRDAMTRDARTGEVVDDPQLVLAWRHTSDPARVELLVGMVRYAVIVGVAPADLPPGSTAHGLLIHALAGQDTSRPDGPLLGPAARHVTAGAAALVADPAVPDRDKRAVCAQYALALLGRGHQP